MSAVPHVMLMLTCETRHRRNIHQLPPLLFKQRQSCHRCFKRKQRCDTLTPRCSNCAPRNLPCSYPDEPDDEPPLPRPSFGLQPTLCSSDHTICGVETPDPVQYEKTLKNYLQIYEQFPLIRPRVVNAIYESAHNQREDEKNYLWAMIDALCSLISLYTESDDVTKGFYESAVKRLNSLKRLSVEGFITRTILVSCSHQVAFSSKTN